MVSFMLSLPKPDGRCVRPGGEVTRSGESAPPGTKSPRGIGVRYAGAAAKWRLLLALLLAAGISPAPASDPPQIGVEAAELVAVDDGYTVNARFAVTLGATVLDALNKGVPVYFRVEFELQRERRYWFNQKVVEVERQAKLSYTPLTRQYRLSVGALYQNFDTLDAALHVLGRIHNWQVAGIDALGAGGEYRASIRMLLDAAQLPGPFQVSLITTRDWNLSSEWRRWTVDPAALAAESLSRGEP